MTIFKFSLYCLQGFIHKYYLDKSGKKPVWFVMYDFGCYYKHHDKIQ